MAITAIEVTTIEPFAKGISFGESGAYERIAGWLQLSVDPSHPRNAGITDIGLAPRDELGLVTARAPFELLRPTVVPPAGGKLLLDVLNRGRRLALRYFNLAPERPQSDPLEPGNGFLMRHGYTVVWVGWQHDVPRTPGNLAIEVPEARQPNGDPVTGRINIQFRTNERVKTRLLSDREHVPYPAADVDEATATLTVRKFETGPVMEIPRADWQFATDHVGGPVADPTHVYLAKGFEPGAVYEVMYTTNFAPVIGLGLLMTRDAVSFFRHANAEQGNPLAGQISVAYGFGASQSGRFLRRFLRCALNADEAGKQVFDGVLPHIAGGGTGEFNQRFGQPSCTAKFSIGNLFPFSDAVLSDSRSGRKAGLLDAQRTLGSVPKILMSNTSTEYWRGDAALTHVSADGPHDVELSPGVRSYLFAGTQHVIGNFPLTRKHAIFGKVRFWQNPVDYSPLLRAALVNLDAWVRDEVLPPLSAVPRLSDGSLEPHTKTTATLDAIGGVQAPQHVAAVHSLDFGHRANEGIVSWPVQPGLAYPLLTPAVDEDGIERAGIRLPDLSVPLGASTGWNLRHPDIGASEQITQLVGAFFPFPGTTHPDPEEDGAKRKGDDMRRSISARYATKADFLSATEDAVSQLIEARHVLAEDADALLRLASVRYDALMT